MPQIAVAGGLVLVVLAGASAAVALARGTGETRGVGAEAGPITLEEPGSELLPVPGEEPGASPVASASPSASASGAAPATSTGAAAVKLGHPVYTQAEIDAWSTGSAEYTRLAGSWAGNVNRAYTPFGPEISSTERDVFRDQSVYIKVQAVLWAADGNAARRAKVVALLNDLRPVTSFQWDSVEQYRLVAGWSATNLAQAAAIVGYNDAAFRRFLVNVCYPILDWPGGPNWHGSFADSKLAIAAYAGDAALWADAKAYFYRRIAQSIYHSTYDGNKVRPLLNANGTPNIGGTRNHWGGALGEAYQQIKTDLTPINPAMFPNGTNAERMRDLGHVSMGLGAFMHGARTILAQGDTLEAHARERLRAGFAHQAQRALGYMNTGVIPAPNTARGDGGEAYLMGWFGACKLFKTSTPAEVQTMCRHSRVTGFAPAGANHLVAEAFADR